MLKIFHEWRFLPWGWRPLTDQSIMLCFGRMMRIYSRFIGDGRVTHWSFWDRSPRLTTQVSKNPFENDLHLLLSHFDTLNNPLAYHMSVNFTSLCRYSFFPDFFAICSHTEIPLFHIFRELCEIGGVILGGLLDATRIACQTTSDELGTRPTFQANNKRPEINAFYFTISQIRIGLGSGWIITARFLASHF